jgi:light-regulated signal transduction histidine kinase (bacteriophytochrome)
VFQNLIGNALKYRKPGCVPKIHIAAESRGNEQILSVRDNGIGFRPEYAEQIFGIFKRLHREEYPGTGIGLAICKRIVERHRGSIWARGEEGRGATFFFTMPGKETGAEAEEAEKPALAF